MLQRFGFDSGHILQELIHVRDKRASEPLALRASPVDLDDSWQLPVKNGPSRATKSVVLVVGGRDKINRL